MIKVKNVKPYTLPDGRETFICEGKLALIRIGVFGGSGFLVDNSHILINNTWYKPIIISESEEIEIKTKVWHNELNLIGEVVCFLETNSYSSYFAVTCGGENFPDGQRLAGIKLRRILAMPEHFSKEQLQMIVNGELKDGDKILLECGDEMIPMEDYKKYGEDCKNSFREIKLDSNNHVVILPNKSEIKVAVVGAGKPEIIKRTYTRDEHLFIYLEGVRAGHDDSTSGESLSRSMMKQRTWFDKNIK